MKSKFLIIGCLLALSYSFSFSQSVNEQFIEFEHDNFFDLIGKKYKCIDDLQHYGYALGVSMDDSFTYSIAGLTKGDTMVYVLQKNVGYEDNQSIHEILDIIVTKVGYYLAYTSCEYENEKVPYLFALVKYIETEEYFSQLYKAWIIDTEEESFKVIDRTKVECFNWERE